MTNTANIPRMLYEEGITGPKADATVYAMLNQHSPAMIATVERMVRAGASEDDIAKGLRQVARQKREKPNEAHIANCMAVARHIARQRKVGAA
jgi:hypothetical protein